MQSRFPEGTGGLPFRGQKIAYVADVTNTLTSRPNHTDNTNVGENAEVAEW